MRQVDRQERSNEYSTALEPGCHRRRYGCRMRGAPALCAACAAAAFVAAAACSPSAPGPDGDPFDAAARLPYITSLSVHRDGAVVREAYYHDTDASTPHDVRSVTKTITSLLVGIALDTDCLRSLDQPIGEALGPRAPSDPAKAAITPRDLLTMLANPCQPVLCQSRVHAARRS
jgi:CubicO group peptidase (beta-lactamase class C family)